jgi:nucleoside-diphosphate-sugar epimerase
VEDVVARAMPNALANDLDHVLSQASGLWEDLRNARVFITGGTGFFGCWLLETLLWANDRLRLNASVVVLTRDPSSFVKKVPHLASHPVVTVYDGDVRTFEFPNGAFSHVIHAAVDAARPQNQEDRVRVFDTIAGGTRHALEFARHCGAKRFLLTSSGAVYGRQPAELTHVPEDYAGGPDPSDRDLAGAEAKRAAEMLCAVHANGELQPTIARCFAFAGPYLPLDAHFAVGNFIRDALQGGPICIRGDGTPYRSYLYAADLAVWLWTILVRGQCMRPYNVGSETAITIADVARAVARTFAPEPEVRTARTATAEAAAADRYVPCTARAREDLGVAMTVDLDEALRRTVDWHRRRLTPAHVED